MLQLIVKSWRLNNIIVTWGTYTFYSKTKHTDDTDGRLDSVKTCGGELVETVLYLKITLIIGTNIISQYITKTNNWNTVGINYYIICINI